MHMRRLLVVLVLFALASSAYATVLAGVLCVLAATGVQSALADESDCTTLTDSTGKHHVQARVLGVEAGKVRLRTKDGRTILVPLDRLNAESRRQVGLLSPPPKEPVPGLGAALPKTIPYPLPTPLARAQMSHLRMHLSIMGIKGRGAANSAMQVSDSLVVSGVPAGYIRALAAMKLSYLKASELIPKGKETDRRLVSRGLAADWVGEAIVFGLGDGPAPGKEGALLRIIRTDGELCAGLATSGSPVAQPSLLKLLWDNFGGDPGVPLPELRDPLPLAELLRRFDPDARVTPGNAGDVAEELVWTDELGIGDGRYENLVNTRMLLQGSILEFLRFEIGDPLDLDPAKRQQARDRLREARATFFETWKMGFAEGGKREPAEGGKRKKRGKEK